jgi:hypothetical protein
MAFKKIDRDFCLSDSTVNCYGFRLLTSGCQLERFNPPIGYLMHERQKGVACRWEDLRIEGDRLLGKPVINTTDFPNLAQQIEDGFYTAASVGHIEPDDMDDSPAMRLAGQSGPTVTRWSFRECSIVDIPGNSNALALFYDKNGNVIRDLSAEPFASTIPADNTPKTTQMAIQLSAAVLAALSLPADATQEAAEVKIIGLAARANQYDHAALELKNLRSEVNKTRVDACLEKGMSERRLTKAVSDQLALSYAENPAGLEALVAAMPVQPIITTQLHAGEIPERFRGKTYDEMYMSGELEALKKECPEYFKTLKTNAHA